MHAHRLDTSPVYYVPHPADDHLVAAALAPAGDRVQLVEFDHVERQLPLDGACGPRVGPDLAAAALGHRTGVQAYRR